MSYSSKSKKKDKKGDKAKAKDKDNDKANGKDKKLQIIPIDFVKGSNKKNYKIMIEKPENKNALFIFNDNVEDHKSFKEGGGNAVVRPYNIHGFTSKQLDKPLSAGISTGLTTDPKTAFSELNSQIKVNNQNKTVKQNINDEIDSANFKLYFS